jgi:hypothetical protein
MDFTLCAIFGYKFRINKNIKLYIVCLLKEEKENQLNSHIECKVLFCKPN